MIEGALDGGYHLLFFVYGSPLILYTVMVSLPLKHNSPEDMSVPIAPGGSSEPYTFVSNQIYIVVTQKTHLIESEVGF